MPQDVGVLQDVRRIGREEEGASAVRRGRDHRQGVERLRQAPHGPRVQRGRGGTGVECLKSNELIPKDAFKAPDPSKWTAPYVKYAPGWWEALYHGNENS